MDVFHLSAGEGPLIAAAIHSGHDIRPDVAALMALDDMERLREEDPLTDELAALVPTRLIGRRSRFEMDLNRPRDQAVYRTPDDAWGLTVWRKKLPNAFVAESLANYELFYATTKALIDQFAKRYGRVVVLDIHSYNHRRAGADGAEADPDENPEINLGTRSVDRADWGSLVDRFVDDLRACHFLGRKLDVRENVKFFGGHFSQWINSTFPGRACAIAIEFKKTFMDEWTGEAFPPRLEALKSALQSTFPGLLAALAEQQASPGRETT
jgi:N-formylglutamate amidohydrolase